MLGALLILVFGATPVSRVRAAAPSNASPGSGPVGRMFGQPIPTPLLIPPNLHATFLAEPASTTQLDGAVFAYGGFWTVTTGYPATLQEVLPSGKVAVSVPLDGAYGAWALAPGPDRTLWVGTYHKGVVFVYSLTTGKVREVARLPVNTVWALAYDPTDGRMWAGTWPDGVYTLSPSTYQVTSQGTVPGEAGPHALAYVNGNILVGTYPTMNVVVATQTGLPNLLSTVTRLLGGSGQVRAIGSLGGHVTVLGANGQLLWVGNSQTDPSPVADQTLSNCETLPFIWDGRTVVVRDQRIVPIEPGTPGAYHARNLPISGAPLASLPSGKYWSAYGVVGSNFYALASDGTLVSVTPGGQTAQSLPDLTAQAGIIQTMASTPWGIFGSSYLGGEVWQNLGSTFTRFGGIDQVDSITACDGRMYLGVYPNARLYVYRPFLPWNPPQNPSLAGSPDQSQDRVPGIACVGQSAYIGTVPQNTTLGGTIYGSNGFVLPSPVPSETPVSLTAYGTSLVGALSNQNALGTPRPAIAAHLFYIPSADLVPGASRAGIRTVSLGHRQTFAGVLTVGSNVFAASREFIARWNPMTGALSVRTLERDPHPAQNWGFTTHFFTAGSHLYLVDDGWVFAVNPQTLAAKRLFYGAQHVAVSGTSAYFAFYYARWDIRIPVANLTTKNAVWPWNFWYIWDHDGHVWPAPKGN